MATFTMTLARICLCPMVSEVDCFIINVKLSVLLLCKSSNTDKVPNLWPSVSVLNWNLEIVFEYCKKKSWSKKRTNNKMNPHMMLGMGIKPGPHWWEVSALTIAPFLIVGIHVHAPPGWKRAS